MGKKKSEFLDYARVAAAVAQLIARGYTIEQISIPKVREEIGSSGSNSTVKKYIDRYFGFEAEVGSISVSNATMDASPSDMRAEIEHEQVAAVELIDSSMTRLRALQRELRIIRHDMDRAKIAVERSIAYSKMMVPPVREMRVLLLSSSDLQRSSVPELMKTLPTVAEWTAGRRDRHSKGVSDHKV